MTPLPIDDPDDPRLAAYTRMRERDLVGRERRFIAEGEVVLRVLLSGHARFRIESVLLAPERWPGWRRLWPASTPRSTSPPRA